MIGFEARIEETLGRPEQVVQSLGDDQVRLYYRYYPATPVSAKFLCVVVKTAIERQAGIDMAAIRTEKPPESARHDRLKLQASPFTPKLKAGNKSRIESAGIAKQP